MKPRKQLTEPKPVDPIEALRLAMIEASEERWRWSDVPEAERVRLRPGVAALANNVTNQLRAEHEALQRVKQ